MDGYRAAAEAVAARVGALNISVTVIDFMGAPLGGCQGHPGAAGHAAMAAAAAPVIAKALGWSVVRPVGAAGHAAGVGGQHTTHDHPHAAAAAAARYLASQPARSRPALAAGTAAAPAPLKANVSLVVRPTPGPGVDYTTIGAAIASLDPAATGHVTLHLLGTFRERVILPAAFTGGWSLVGDGASPSDSVIVFNRDGKTWGTFATHTLLVAAPDVTLVNVAVANDAGGYNSAVAAQSVALHVAPTGDRLACWGCALWGGQDTVYTGSAGYGLRSFFYASYSNGSCDGA
jgi:pectin methylesterase-like acyl-CoA thioesterase